MFYSLLFFLVNLSKRKERTYTHTVEWKNTFYCKMYYALWQTKIWQRLEGNLLKECIVIIKDSAFSVLITIFSIEIQITCAMIYTAPNLAKWIPSIKQQNIHNTQSGLLESLNPAVEKKHTHIYVWRTTKHKKISNFDVDLKIFIGKISLFAISIISTLFHIQLCPLILLNPTLPLTNNFAFYLSFFLFFRKALTCILLTIEPYTYYIYIMLFSFFFILFAKKQQHKKDSSEIIWKKKGNNKQTSIA